MSKMIDLSESDRYTIAAELSAIFEEHGTGYTIGAGELTGLIGKVAGTDRAYAKVASVLVDHSWLDAASTYEEDTQEVINAIIEALRKTDD